AGVDVARADRDRGGDPGDDDGARRAEVDVAVAELAVEVVAPAFDGAVTQEGAGMHGSRGDRGRVADAADRRRGGERWEARSVTELSAAIAAPAADGAVGDDGAGMQSSFGREGNGVADARDRNRCRREAGGRRGG